MLTKGPIAIVLLSITALLCLLHPKTRAATLQLRWGQGAGIVLAIAAPWFLTMWYRFGPRFVDQYVLYNNLSLFGRPLYRANRYPFFYGRVFLTGFLPWSPILLARIVDIVRSRTSIRSLHFGSSPSLRGSHRDPSACRGSSSIFTSSGGAGDVFIARVAGGEGAGPETPVCAAACS